MNIRKRSIYEDYPEFAGYVRDYIPIDSMIYGYWEKREMKATQYLIKQLGLRKIFIDVGANIGCTSLCIGKYFNYTYAFEPSEETHSLLCHNLKFNFSGRYTTEKFALGARKSKGRISTNKANRAGSRAQIWEEAAEGEEIEIIKLDDYIAANDIDNKDIDYIKIDVEGFESEVIKGAKELFKKGQPLVGMEYHPELYKGVDHFQYLESMGYTLWSLEKKRLKIQIDSLWRIFSNIWGNKYKFSPVKAKDIFEENKYREMIYCIPNRLK